MQSVRVGSQSERRYRGSLPMETAVEPQVPRIERLRPDPARGFIEVCGLHFGCIALATRVGQHAAVAQRGQRQSRTAKKETRQKLLRTIMRCFGQAVESHRFRAIPKELVNDVSFE